jgi:hypothetical protein
MNLIERASQSLKGPTGQPFVFITGDFIIYWYSFLPINKSILLRLPQCTHLKKPNPNASIPVPFTGTPVPSTRTPLAFAGTSIPLARTPLSRRLTRHNRLVCLTSIDIVCHRMLWRLGWCTPLEVLVLVWWKERLCGWYM